MAGKRSPPFPGHPHVRMEKPWFLYRDLPGGAANCACFIVRVCRAGGRGVHDKGFHRSPSAYPAHCFPGAGTGLDQRFSYIQGSVRHCGFLSGSVRLYLAALHEQYVFPAGLSDGDRGGVFFRADRHADLWGIVPAAAPRIKGHAIRGAYEKASSWDQVLSFADRNPDPASRRIDFSVFLFRSGGNQKLYGNKKSVRRQPDGDKAISPHGFPGAILVMLVVASFFKDVNKYLEEEKQA